MDVLLINPTYYSVYDLGLSYGEPLGLAYIAAVIEKSEKHSVNVLDSVGLCTKFIKVGNKTRMGLAEEEIIAMIREKKSDVIGISLTGTMYSQDILELIRLIKAAYPEKVIIVGGVHATLEYEGCMNKAPIDFIVLGEGEGTIIELLNAMENKTAPDLIKGIVYRDPATKKLVNTGQRAPVAIDSIPLPARHLFPMNNYFRYKPHYYFMRHPAASVITSRACPFNCIFCSTTLFWDKKYRTRNAISVVDEIEFLVKQYQVKEILINDDCFLGNKKRIVEICDEIIKRKINITYQIPPGVNFHLLDEELLKKLRDSGLYAIKPQFESGNETTLKYIRKKINLDKGKKIISYANKLGLWTQTNCIIGFPHETKEDILSSIKYIESIPFDSVSYLVPIPFTHTDLREDYVKHNLIQACDPVNMDSPVNSLFLSNKEITRLRNRARRRQSLVKFKRLINPVFFFCEFFPKINSVEKSKFLFKRILYEFIKL